MKVGSAGGAGKRAVFGEESSIRPGNSILRGPSNLAGFRKRSRRGRHLCTSPPRGKRESRLSRGGLTVKS